MCFLLKNPYYDICILHKELEGRLNEMGCDQFKY